MSMERLQKLQEAVQNAVRSALLQEEVIPKVYFSDESGSCGMNQAGVIGFRFAAEDDGDGFGPVFTLFFNQGDGENPDWTEKVYGVIPERDIPLFIVELGETIGYTGKSFKRWMVDHEEGFGKVAGQYLR